MDNVDVARTAKQDDIVLAWGRTYYGNGVVEAATGFGKTNIGIKAILKIVDINPQIIVNIVVPATEIKAQWDRKIEELNLKHVYVYVVNSYVKREWSCHLLIADEVHRYLSEDAFFFNKVLDVTKRKFFLGLSATLTEEEKDRLADKGIPIVATVTREEAEANNWVAPSVTYNFEVSIPEADREKYGEINQQFHSYFNRFIIEDRPQFSLALACASGANIRRTVKVQTGPKTYKNMWIQTPASQIREEYARMMGWDETIDHEWSPRNLQKYAMQFNRAMQARKKFLYEHPKKIEIVKEIVEYYNDKRIIVFSESTALADATAAEIPKISRAYHSNVKTQLRRVNGKFKKVGKTVLLREALEEFQDDNSPVRVLLTAKALDEGFDFDKISVGIQQSYTSKNRRLVQRKGRSGRKDYDDSQKVSIFINLFVPETQEEKWLKKSLDRDRRVINVSKVDELLKI